MSHRRALVLLLSLCALALGATALFAEPGDSSGGIYRLTSSLHGGGGQSSGGPYSLTATIGQEHTSVSQSGNTQLRAGFWQIEDLDFLFKDGFEGDSL